jgi:murein DD-endopeptidase MepM/ murein hydrolase activator NlpD
MATARPLTRIVTHFVVIGIVATSAALGFAVTRSATDDAAGGRFLSLDLVAQARGAAAASSQLPSAATFELQPDPNRPDPMLSRRVVTLAPTPLPTPVAPPPAPPDPTPAPVVAARPQVVQGNGQLAWPVAGGTITQYFSSGHLALDIAANSGTTVVAADGGTVTWAGWRNNGGGMVVAIDHGNGITTVYNHLGAIWVTPGQAVARGAGIGAVGCTGTCTGPHVHFEVIVGGVLVNPLRYL